MIQITTYINQIKVPVIFTGSFAIALFFLLSTAVFAQKKAKIEILGANSFEMDSKIKKGAKRLIGDVRLKHEDALMFCDSAYVYSESNTMDAYGHVKIIQGDSLQLFGDSLKYNGETKKAELRGNIKLVNSDVTLITNYLDFNREDNIAYYYGGGAMINRKENNNLTSKEGYYYSTTEAFYFKKDVVLINPEYKIEADTLNYNSASEIVNFLGPTTITSDSNFIYTEDGWYNTSNNQSKFFKNAFIYSDKKTIRGDTLFYDRNDGFSQIICNAEIIDTIENIILKGDLAYFFEKQDSAMIIQEALLMQLFDKDTLYLHADTFKISTQYIMNDSMAEKSIDTLRTLLAYTHAKFYKKDMQGKADSIVYDFSDSTIQFYNDPVIWSKENQLTADFMYIKTVNNKPNAIYLEKNAFIVSKVDSLSDNYNQIKGENLIGYFKKEQLYKIDVKKNAETIYYSLDDDGKYIGVNKMSGNDMLIFLDGNELQTITFIKDPKGELKPVQQVSPKEVILKGFNWRVVDRPIDRFDIFIW